MSKRLGILLFSLLLAASFSTATVLQSRTPSWSPRSGSETVLKVLLGDGRRLFANHFFVKADVYFHSGYYPSIFDQAKAPTGSDHLTEKGGHDAEEEHMRQMDFIGQPRDWIERFGRHFQITEHKHLAGQGEREILPWLKISAELDPQRIDTYTVAAYWLRRDLNKPMEAEKFLRDGLRNNPGNYELLYELGRLYMENYKDPVRARNVWEMALRGWHQQEDKKEKPDLRSLGDICDNLAEVEEQSGDLEAAIKHLRTSAKCSPVPDAIQRHIEELQKRLTNAPTASH